MRCHICALMLIFAAVAESPASESWPEYRGPSQNGHSDATGLPLSWSESENVRWKTPIRGRAWSSPVIFGNQVWLTTATPDGKKMYAVCVSRESGTVVHNRLLFDVPEPRPLGNTVNSYGTPSPVIERGRVYISFGSYGTACLDTVTAKTFWERRDLPCHHWRGPASSPYVYGDLLFLHMDGADHQYIVALDKATGETVWRTGRSTDYGDLDENGQPKAGGDYRKAYNTPIVMRAAGGVQLISPSAKAFYAYDPLTGKEIWQVRHPAHSTAARPLFHEGLAILSTGFSQTHLWAVKLDGRGDTTDTHVAWKVTKGAPKRCSPLLIDGLLYLCTDKGVVTCLDATMGKQVWQLRIGGNHSASPVYADGRIYFFSEEGETVVLKPGRTAVVLGKNQLDDGFMASPAIVGKAFFLRTKTHLYRIEG